NAFACVVSRHAGDLFPLCSDAEGTLSLLPLDFEDAQLRLSCRSVAEIEALVTESFTIDRYHAPSTAGIAYGLYASRWRIDGTRGRRSALIKGAAMLAVAATARAQGQPPAAEQPTTLADVPLGPSVTVTVERRGDIVLVGLNRPFIQNRIDPPMRLRLAATFYQYEHDPSLRALLLFGHGGNFSRGIDVDAAQAAIMSGQRPASDTPTLDVLGNSPPHRSKPVVVVAHGDTWNLGHEIYLASDVRVAAANTRFGQDENTHGRFPGGGATVRFVRDA